MDLDDGRRPAVTTGDAMFSLMERLWPLCRSITGTAPRDFLRCRDLERVPEDLAALYEEGALIYQPAG